MSIEYDQARERFYVEELAMIDGAPAAEALVWKEHYQRKVHMARVHLELAMYILEGREAGKSDAEIAAGISEDMRSAFEAEARAVNVRGWLSRLLRRKREPTLLFPRS